MDGTVVPIVVQNIRAAYEALQYRVQRALQTQLGDQYRLGLVMAKFGSEPRSEPEPDRTEPQFRVRVRVLA